MQYLEQTFRDVKACARELAAEKESEKPGSKETLTEGDVVLKRKDLRSVLMRSAPHQQQESSHRR